MTRKRRYDTKVDDRERNYTQEHRRVRVTTEDKKSGGGIRDKRNTARGGDKEPQDTTGAAKEGQKVNQKTRGTVREGMEDKTPAQTHLPTTGGKRAVYRGTGVSTARGCLSCGY